ncbi:MAG: sigma-54-dependent Fis family transcriptional regulator [Proteobacteria bacterium]|nr:sigma-54-dependent Fis family transcriptional regulator [Pseudomonadota bacterium]
MSVLQNTNRLDLSNDLYTGNLIPDGQVEKAWESFIGTGDLSKPSVREVILKSWIKSRRKGLSPQTERAPTTLSVDELKEMARTMDLCQEGAPVMNKLSDILNDTQHVVVLADARGRILHSVGNEQVQDRLERINFKPGAAWSEDVAGSNGIGTPLSLRRPELVMGHEHYCRGWHPWVCYGAPVYDVTGTSIKGLVDVTGPVKDISKETMAMTISIAQSIQYCLTNLHFRRREELHELGKEKLRQWPGDGVMVLDENGYIVDYNDNAIRYLNLDPDKFFSRPISVLVPNLAKPIHQSYQSKNQLEMTTHSSKQSGLLLPVRVILEPIVKGNRSVGMVVIVNEINKSVRPKSRRVPTQSLPQSRYTFENIRGSSEKIKTTICMARAAARDPLQSNVLLIGETGTGKELLAHSIHSDSALKNGPFIAINCAAIPHDLIESELFGYVAGAFTGASRDGLKGKFESAHNGTLFLDEINSMSLDLQAKFLRVLDSMEVSRVGSSESILVNVRIISAANESIHNLVEDGKFRLDLFHRLNVFEIPIPKLTDRGNDIIELANEFLQVECTIVGRETLQLSPDVEELMKNYNWPGNIRELNNICLRWVLTVPGKTISYVDVPERISKFELINRSIDSGDNLRSISDELIKRTLKQTGNNVSKAARILGIDRSTIYRRRRCW